MQDEKKLNRQICATLNASVDNLEPDIRQHLQQARHAALAKAGKPRIPFWQPAGVFALASILLLAILILPQRHHAPQAVALADIEFIATDNLPLYENLAFYQWLLENETNAG